jgi:vacuolar protein sorting-associated protein 1
MHEVNLLSVATVSQAHATRYRCPMECTMSSNAAAWSCTISLRMGYDNNGSAQGTTTVPFGRTIFDRDEVEVWLRRAQAAILNPNVPPSDFHGKTIDELRNRRNSLKFSRNVICVLIKDPDATDLSFYDLPGKYTIV